MKEIVPYGTSTKVPLIPDEIRGLINLRGRAIPVLDLAVRFGGEKTEVTNRTCVLIVDLADDQDRPDMGILADSVSRVIEIGPTELEDTPNFGLGISPDYLLGMAKQGRLLRSDRRRREGVAARRGSQGDLQPG
jgi:purine-binding chemotaxis protein CheW